jgi:hypothetical protein
MIRPDVGLGSDPRARPVLFETNATALAGLYNHTAGVAILRRRSSRRCSARRADDSPIRRTSWT